MRFGIVLTLVAVIAALLRRRKAANGGDPAFGDAQPGATPAAATRATQHADWADPYWEPFKIALGTLYALCLQRGFDSAVDHFEAHPVDITAGWAEVLRGHTPVVIADLVAYVIWLSLFFLYNARLYMLLPKKPSRTRITAYASLTASFGAFYFFAASLGPPDRVQALAISLVLLVDIAFPLHLGVVTHVGARLWWVARDVAQLTVAVLVLSFASDEVMRSPIWVYLLLGLLVTQLFIAPREYRYQRDAEVGGGRRPRKRGR